MRRWLLSLGTVIVLVTAGAFATAEPASANAGVNVESYCQWAYGYHADLVNNNVYGWMCNPVPGNAYYRNLWRLYGQGSVDMVTQCHRENYATAAFTDYNNPYSWYCHN